ncbi:hypothetical protein [Microbulbifer sp. HZ11]|uniref:hypothetical protein n=1 Tax=unclassified Microbulbifer TaxID=2619833 RepID=UPI0005BC7404|nr:hypothetical protein [Microbulbifer sp. HZ11]
MASWVPIVVIIFAVVLVIGPVMWLKPSSRDRKLAELRHKAASAGLKVQMQTLPAAIGEGTAATYFSQWRNPRRLNTGWVLEMQRMSHEMHFEGTWDWRKGRAAPEAAQPPLRELISMLPSDVTAIFANDSGLGVQWRERTGDVGFAKIQQALAVQRPVIEEAIRQPTRSESGEV